MKTVYRIAIVCAATIVLITQIILPLAGILWWSSYDPRTEKETIEPEAFDPKKITTMKPDSMRFFYYPNPSDTENRDAYNTFMLIRLPAWLGGDAEDSSAYRAYSAKAVDDPCLVKYWGGEGRQRIENPCRGGFYRVVDGLGTIGFGAVPSTYPVALPHLNLSNDENGFLYIESPTWSKTENGVLGYGKEVTSEDVKKGSQFLIDSAAKEFPDFPKIPLKFAGLMLADMNLSYKPQSIGILYSDFTPAPQFAEMKITKCGCQKVTGYYPDSMVQKIGKTEIIITDEEIPGQAFRYTHHVVFVKNSFEFRISGEDLGFIRDEIKRNFLAEHEGILTFDYEIKTESVTHGNQYEIKGGIVDEITYDNDSNSMIILMQEAEAGFIQIVIPSGLFAPINKDTVVDYLVIQDGKETPFEQLSPIILKIPFQDNTKKIEIIGMMYP